MADTPHGGHTGNFLAQSTAGLPNWAWLLVIAGGITAAIFIPKLLPGAQSTSTATPSGSGLGLAVDPTTGLPYATEGLVPSGASAGTSAPPPIPTSPTTAFPPTNAPTLSSVFTRAQQPGVVGQNSIPIWQTPNADWNQDIGSIPINSPVQVGSPVQTGTQTFYPISYNGTTGYVASWDLAGLPLRQNWPDTSLRTRHYQTTG